MTLNCILPSAALLVLLPTCTTQAREIHIRGHVTDETGKAVEGAAIKLQLLEQAHPMTIAFDGLLGTASARTNREGSFEVTNLTLKDARRWYVLCDVLRDGFVDKQERISLSPEKAKESSLSFKVQITRGKTVACRVIDPSGNPVAGAEVLAGSHAPYFTCFRRETDRDGMVRLSVPKTAEHVTVVVNSAKGARHRQTIFPNNTAPTQITLQHGTRVTGKLVDTQGRPLPGSPVMAERNEKSFPSIKVVVKTQADGSFDFGELRGEFLVSTPRSDREWPTDIFVPSPQPPAVIEPQTITLEQNAQPVELSLRSCRTVMITGSVTDYLGRPVAGKLMSIYALPSATTQVLLDLPITDAKGRYESRRVPLGAKNVQISAVGMSQIKGDIYLKPKASPHVTFASPRGDHVLYEQITADLVKIDFQCLLYRPSEGFLKTVPKELSEGEVNPQKQQAPSEAAKERYRELLAKEQSFLAGIRQAASEPGITRSALMEQNARRWPEFGREHIALAEQFPNDPVAVEALLQHFVFGALVFTPTAEPAARLILERHAKSETFVQMAPKVIPMLRTRLAPATEILLRGLSQQSDRREIQALASYSLAYLLQNKAEGAASSAVLQESGIEAEEGAAAFGPWMLNTEKWLAKTDIARTRKEAEELYRRIIDEFSAQQFPSQREGAKLGELAREGLYALLHLSIGANVPETKGQDTDDVKFKLSDYRGKVIVLVFSAQWCGPCKLLYPKHRELIAKYKDRPFALLGVSGDESKSAVTHAMARGDVTWRCFFGGGPDNPIVKQWRVDSWPTIVIIDHKGVIRLRKAVTGYERLIERLVVAAEDQARPARK